MNKDIRKKLIQFFNDNDFNLTSDEYVSTKSPVVADVCIKYSKLEKLGLTDEHFGHKWSIPQDFKGRKINRTAWLLYQDLKKYYQRFMLSLELSDSLANKNDNKSVGKIKI